MKKIFLLIIFYHFIVFVKGQDNDICETCSKDGVFLLTEKPAVYKGGNSQLYADLNTKLKLSKKINGRVAIGMLISKEGIACCFEFLNIISNQKIDLDKSIKDAMIVALKELQNWQPCTQRDRAVNCSYTLLIDVTRGKCGAKK